MGAIARVAAPGAEVRVLLSITERDRAAGLRAVDATIIDRLAVASHEAGLQLCDARLATEREITASHSTWAKRLHAGSRRPVWLLDWIRLPGSEAAASASIRG
jgi:16S rRNA (adenine(1408)-N(1))-methyltransferase